MEDMGGVADIFSLLKAKLKGSGGFCDLLRAKRVRYRRVASRDRLPNLVAFLVFIVLSPIPSPLLNENKTEKVRLILKSIVILFII